MAVPTVQTLQSGDRNLVIQVVGEADVAGGTIVNVSSLAKSSRGESVVDVRLESIRYSSDAEVKLDWDATADVTFMTLAAGQEDLDFCDIGGIQNNAGAGKTGNVLIPAPPAAANYHMTLTFKKRY